MEYSMLLGDCRDVMRVMPANVVDTIITDPPYALQGKSGKGGFMGELWDTGDAAFDIETWRLALRVAKPGATLLAFGGTRTYHRLVCAIEDAGWEIRDCIMWLYGSGFPKSANISKLLDKAAGEENVIGAIPDRWSGKGSVYGYSKSESRDLAKITAPATPLAQQWDGWGTALKPAFEPVVVAQKPLDGTYAANARKWGVAGLWLGGSRIGGEVTVTRRSGKSGAHGRFGKDDRVFERVNPPGRFPANVIMDDEAGAMLDAQSPGSSRFFYCAKAGKSEKQGGNSHPTIKPLALMQYLCRLTKTPTGGVVLDPFAGSGSTGVAALAEGREFIGIEMNAEYYEICKSRLAKAVEDVT